MFSSFIYAFVIIYMIISFIALLLIENRNIYAFDKKTKELKELNSLTKALLAFFWWLTLYFIYRDRNIDLD